MKNIITSVMLAVIFFAVGGYCLFQTIDYLKGATPIDGAITHIEILRRGARATISFELAGQAQSAVVPVSRLRRVGDRVSVYYHSTKTPAVKLNSFTSIWLFPLGFLAAGLVSLILGVIKRQ